MQTIVVMGGAGFIGSHLCERALDEGYAVECLDDLSSGRLENLAHLRERSLSFRQCDVSQPWGGEVDGDVAAVFHLASAASPRFYLSRPLETLRAGSAGTLWGLDVARRHDARFLLASTSEIYGDPMIHPQTEAYWGNVNPIGPRSPYDEGKRFAEAATVAHRETYGTKASIARIFNTHGPRMRTDDGRAVPSFAVQALRGEPLTVTGDGLQTRSLMFVSDLVEGLWRLQFADEQGPVNLGHPRETTVLEIAQIIRDAAGSRSPIVFTPRPVDDPSVRQPDISLARRALGWEPRIEVREGLERTVGYFREHLTDADTVHPPTIDTPVVGTA